MTVKYEVVDWGFRAHAAQYKSIVEDVLTKANEIGRRSNTIVSIQFDTYKPWYVGDRGGCESRRKNATSLFGSIAGTVMDVAQESMREKTVGVIFYQTGQALQAPIEAEVLRFQAATNPQVAAMVAKSLSQLKKLNRVLCINYDTFHDYSDVEVTVVCIFYHRCTVADYVLKHKAHLARAKQPARAKQQRRKITTTRRG